MATKFSRAGKPGTKSHKAPAHCLAGCKGIRAVTFDVGGTLIQPWPSVGHVYAEVAACHGCAGVSIEALNRQFAAAWRALKCFNYTRQEWATVVEATFFGLIDGAPTRTFFSELYDRFSEPGAWRIFPDVLPTLKTLKARGLMLGIISNWDRRLGPLLRRLKLKDQFDIVVVSCHVGAPKPARVIFEQAARRLRLPPEAMLHVGDDLDLDVRGAQAAGLQSVWLRRSDEANRRDGIRTLNELWESHDGVVAGRGPCCK